jgi:hypothetical protein
MPATASDRQILCGAPASEKRSAFSSEKRSALSRANLGAANWLAADWLNIIELAWVILEPV